ncbi:UDP-N-acetylmuramoyl-tripeptide--D-alanyl-D-alanine ligase, partial [Georgenia sp. 10Sc9-8]|nr:UDP-N-acetylmuramoyl-tripeptide--D-alanyl-D-alanine ligase [Georgenia halotolerans]
DDRTEVTGEVVIDSREVTPGALFAALPGERTDGHAHLPAALSAGAAGALVSDVRAARASTAPSDHLVLVADVTRALGDLARHVLAELRRRRAGQDPLRVVAVTGSVGKTTTKDLLADLLAPLGELIAPPGSFNNEIGLPLTVLRAGESTRTLVLEMGADRVGNLRDLTAIAPPDVAVVLRVARAHLGEFGGIEQVARAKGELVTGLVPAGIAVLNADDPRVAAMAGLAPGAVRTFGTGEDAQVRAAGIALDTTGRAEFTLHVGDRAVPVRLGLVGAHHVTNALAAATVATTLGLAPEDVAAALGRSRARSPHRMHVVDRADGVRVIDDSYNANPDSVRAGLRALVASGQDGGRRTVAVLGEMLELGADHDAEHHALGAEAADLGVDVVLAVGTGAAAVARGAAAGGATATRELPDVAATARALAEELRAGDVVLVKGSHGTGLWRLADDLLAGEVAGGDAR